MKRLNLKPLVPHAIAIIIFLIATLIFCKPALESKLKASDTIGWQGMAQQSFEYKEKNGHFPLWTNSLFGGMPTYQIAMDGNEKVGKGIEIINLGHFNIIEYF